MKNLIKTLSVSIFVFLILIMAGCSYNEQFNQGNSDKKSSNKTEISNVVKSSDLANIVDVYASTDDGNVAANTIDNDLSTRWSGEGDGAYILFELSEVTTVAALNIAWHKGDQRQSHFEIYLSENETSNYIKVFDGESSGNTSDFEAFSFSGQDCKYVKIVGYGNTSNNWNSISEVQIVKGDSSVENLTPVIYEITPDQPIIAEAGQTINLKGKVDDKYVNGQYTCTWTTDKGDTYTEIITHENSDNWINFTTNYSFTLDSSDLGKRTITLNVDDGFGGIGSSVTYVYVVSNIDGKELTVDNVYASDDDGHVAGNVIDNDLNTRWSADGDGQWIILELDKKSLVTSIDLAWYKGDERVSEYQIYLEINGNFYMVSHEWSSGTTLQLENTSDFKTSEVTAVKIVGFGNSSNSWNSITELKVNGYDL